MQLKVIQEVITLIIFTVFTTVFFKGETLHWNHLAAFVCLITICLFCVYEITVSATLKQRLRLASTEVLFYINGGSIRMKWSLRLYAYLQSIFLFGIRHISFHAIRIVSFKLSILAAIYKVGIDHRICFTELFSLLPVPLP